MKTAQEIRLLLIENTLADAQMVIDILKETSGQFGIKLAHTISEGLEMLQQQKFDVTLLNLSLSDGSGVQMVDTILARFPQLPIIVLADADDAQTAAEAIRKGAQDSLVKGETPPGVLIRAINYAIWRKQSQLTLQRTVQALKEANKKILDQQKSVIEEERLKMMLQMAGATAHELNQPLMSLLGYLELIELEEGSNENYLAGIKKAGKRISGIVKKIQSIRLDCVIPHAKGPETVNLEQNITLLSLEDSDQDFGRLAEILKNQPQVNLLRAVTLKEAFQIIDKHPVELIFLDHVLPDGTSFDFMRKLKEKEEQIPVVVITGQGDEMVASQIIQAGAYDYINKSHLNLPSVSRIVKNAMEKFHLKREMQKAFDRLAEMATKDELTGLLNRRLMYESLNREMQRVERYDSDLACLMIDLDHFKQINDTYGHLFGDTVLKEFSASLQELVRSTDLIFRYGGEEFALLLSETNLYGCLQIAEKIRSHFEQKHYSHETNSVVITVSIGVASVKHHHIEEGQTLLTYADKALYHAKANGRNQVQIYSDAIGEDGQTPAVPLNHVKNQIKLLLDKTRKSAIASIERLVTDRSQLDHQTETQRVITCLELLAKKLNFPTAIVETLKQSARLHDYLEVILMEGLMHKQAPLSNAEKAEIEDHPNAIAEMVDLFDFFSDIRQVLLYHHERYDGSGYPEGLYGDQIPLGARLLSVVNAFVAMTSEKSYRGRLSDEQVLQELARGAETQFDPVMVAMVLEIIEEYHLLDVDEKAIKQARRKVRTICEKSSASLKNLICQTVSNDMEKLNICGDQ